jgi:hypothetical protein
MFLCVELSAQQQGSALRFGSSTIDLGHIREEGGVVRCDVDAINSGKDTIYIKEILSRTIRLYLSKKQNLKNLKHQRKSNELLSRSQQSKKSNLIFVGKVI